MVWLGVGVSGKHAYPGVGTPRIPLRLLPLYAHVTHRTPSLQGLRRKVALGGQCSTRDQGYPQGYSPAKGLVGFCRPFLDSEGHGGLPGPHETTRRTEEQRQLQGSPASPKSLTRCWGWSFSIFQTK